MLLHSIFFGAFLQIIILQTAIPDVAGSQHLSTMKTRIVICCLYKDDDIRGCTDGLLKEQNYLSVTLSNGTVVKRNLLTDFIVFRHQVTEFDIWIKDAYTLFENGTLLLASEINEMITDWGDYCLHPNQFRSGNTELIMVSVPDVFFDSRYSLMWELPVGGDELTWLSEVFLIFTIAVYLYEEKLQNLHGKLFICYMFATFMYNLFLWLGKGTFYIVMEVCVLYTYNFHFFLVSKFTWLLSLSHQMWKGISSVNRAESEHSFLAYSIFAWGTAAIVMGAIFLIDQIFDGNPNMMDWIPGVGWNSCDLKRGWSYHVYVTGPFLILIALNTIYFILTTISIIRVKLLLWRFPDNGGKAGNHCSIMTNYTMFLRLLVVMDIQWSVRSVSEIFNWDLLLEICVYTDFCFGILIFVLFILKRSTVRLLMERCRNLIN